MYTRAAGRLGCGQTVADAGNSCRRFTLLGVGPALENPAKGRPLGESVFTRERHAIVAVGVGGGDISGEDRGHAGQPKGVGKGVGMSQLPALRERAIGSSGGLIRIAAMPKRPGQLDKGADPDVLPVAKGGIAMLARADTTTRPFRNARGLHGNRRYTIKDKARMRWPTRSGPDEGCDWADDRKLVACSSAAAIAPALRLETQSP